MINVRTSFCHTYGPPGGLHSFPTRRSSDLGERCRKAARQWSRWKAQQRYRATTAGKQKRNGQSQRYREHVKSRKPPDRKSTRLNSSHEWISYAVFCLKKKKKKNTNKDSNQQ